MDGSAGSCAALVREQKKLHLYCRAARHEVESRPHAHGLALLTARVSSNLGSGRSEPPWLSGLIWGRLARCLSRSTRMPGGSCRRYAGSGGFHKGVGACAGASASAPPRNPSLAFSCICIADHQGIRIFNLTTHQVRQPRRGAACVACRIYPLTCCALYCRHALTYHWEPSGEFSCP